MSFFYKDSEKKKKEMTSLMIDREPWPFLRIEI